MPFRGRGSVRVIPFLVCIGLLNRTTTVWKRNAYIHGVNWSAEASAACSCKFPRKAERGKVSNIRRCQAADVWKRTYNRPNNSSKHGQRVLDGCWLSCITSIDLANELLYLIRRLHRELEVDAHKLAEGTYCFTQKGIVPVLAPFSNIPAQAVVAHPEVTVMRLEVQASRPHMDH